MGTDKAPQIKHGHVVFAGSKGSGKSSLYQCLKSPNPHVMDGSSCSVLVEDWRPFSNESPIADECREYFNGNLSEDDLDASVTVWDICGLETLWTTQQLCIPEAALFVLVFNVRNPRDAGRLPLWVQMIQAKSLGAEIIIAASNCEVSDGSCEMILDEIKKMEEKVLAEINEELLSLRELQSNIWIKNRIEILERMVNNRANVCSTVHLTSAVTGKGLSDLRRAILSRIFAEKSGNVQSFSEQELGLIKKLRPLHDGKGIVMSGEDYKAMASSLGFQNDEELASATQTLEKKGVLSRTHIAGTLEQPDDTIIITDPWCFANACAMIHRDENPQDFVNKLQKSTLVQRFWPTSTRPNDWTLRSAIEDVVSRGMIRESFFPLCWQVWNMNEEDIKQLLPVMLKLGVISDGAPKAGYEIELALSYFKNLSVTKRYHLPLLNKLPTEPPSEVWPNLPPSSIVAVDWHYQFQDGFCDDLSLSILAACKNFKPSKTVLAYWQSGLVVRLGDVDILMTSKPRTYQLSARCNVSNGTKQALKMAWATLAQFIHIAESYLSNFPGLYYRFGIGSPSIVSSSKNVHQLLVDSIQTNENNGKNLWLIPPIHFQKKETLSLPPNPQTWMLNLSVEASVRISYKESHKEEAEVLGTNLEKSGFSVQLQSSELASSDTGHGVQPCSVVIMFLTRTYVEDTCFEENIKVFESHNKDIIGAYFEADLKCSLSNTADLSAGSGSGSGHIFNPEQLQILISESRNLIFGTGDIEPLSDATGDPVSGTVGDFGSESHSEPVLKGLLRPAVSNTPAMETGQREENSQPKKKHVKFQSDHVTEIDTSATKGDDQIKPLAACTVAAAMVGAAAEHLSQSRKASSASMRAANATAKVARAVAHGDADAATDALNDVVRIVDGLSSTLKQKGSDYESPKSKTCVVL